MRGRLKLTKLQAFLAAALIASVSTSLECGSSRAPTQKPELADSDATLQFEVASIHPAEPSTAGIVAPRCRGVDSRFAPGDPGAYVPVGRCAGSVVRLDNLMVLAYDFPSVQMIRIAEGGPAWAKSNEDRFAFTAKADDPSSATEQDLRRMLQSLLSDRFKLKFHRETRETDGFAITVGNAGPKMQKAREDEAEKITRTGPGRDHIEIVARKISMSRLALFLTTGAGKGPVVDRTGLEGAFDFTLTSDENTGPSLVTAMQEQLGLRLERQKVPLEWLVIDSAEKPQPNQ